jgi:thiamine pyrophosphokinase
VIIRIIAGGPNPYVPKTNGTIIAVDRGLETALQLGVPIHLVVGDFDSTSVSLAKGLPTIQLHKEKDETDLQVAVQEALKLQPETIYIHGATNGRYDHTHAAIGLLGKGDIRLVDEINEIRVLHAGSTEVTTKDYVSFFHYSGQPSLTLEGFHYPLKDYLLQPFDGRCISNELKKTTGHVHIQGGHVLMVISKKD